MRSMTRPRGGGPAPTLTAGDCNMARFETEYENSEDDGRLSHRLGVQTPMPLLMVEQESADANQHDGGYRSVSSGPVGRNTEEERCHMEVLFKSITPGGIMEDRNGNGTRWNLGMSYYRTDGHGEALLGREMWGGANAGARISYDANVCLRKHSGWIYPSTVRREQSPTHHPAHPTLRVRR